MKKKSLCLLLTSAIALGLTGCDKTVEPVLTPANTTAATIAATSTTPAETIASTTTETTSTTTSEPVETTKSKHDEANELLMKIPSYAEIYNSLFGSSAESNETTKPTETTKPSTTATVDNSIWDDPVETTKPAKTTTVDNSIWDEPVETSKPDSNEREFTFDGIKGTYSGDWENGMPNGNGTFTDNDILIMTGEWTDGRPDGKFKVVFTGTITIDGYYKDNKLISGEIVTKDENGTLITYSIYTPQHYDVAVPEKIVYEFSNGSTMVFDGIWNLDWKFANGTITLIFPNGYVEKVCGQWGESPKDKNDWYMHTADYYLYFTDGTEVRYSGNWNPDGEFDQGLQRIDNPDGSYFICDGQWKDNKFYNGTYQYIDTNGKLQTRGKVKNGKWGSDWEKIIGNSIKLYGEIKERDNSIVGKALEKIGDVVADHGALSSFN